MDSEFWKTIWEEGKTGFHQGTYHEKLLQYFPTLGPVKGQSVFVPLCGKTRDMFWLHEQGLNVRGIELHGPAIQAFFEENKLPLPKITMDENYLNYNAGHITISCGDFFKVTETGFYDFVYDRAALVALPEAMRKVYAGKIDQVLKTGGKCLLISYEYDSAELSGPPFSVTEDEIHSLYDKKFSVKLLERMKPAGEAGRLTAAPSIRQTVYILEKLS